MPISAALMRPRGTLRTGPVGAARGGPAGPRGPGRAAAGRLQRRQPGRGPPHPGGHRAGRALAAPGRRTAAGQDGSGRAGGHRGRARGVRRAPGRAGTAVPGPDGPGVRRRRPGGVPGGFGDGRGARGDGSAVRPRPLPVRPGRPPDPQRPGPVRHGRRTAAARRRDHRRAPRRSHRPAAGRPGPAADDGRLPPTPARTRGPPNCWPRRSSAWPAVPLPALERV